MKFALLSDIHLGSDSLISDNTYKGVLRKINQDADKYLRNFVKEMNESEDPSFVVVLGDLIDYIDETEDKKNIKQVVEILRGLKCPVHYVAGNSDLQNISENELLELLNQKELYYSFDHEDFHVNVLHSKVVGRGNISIDDKQQKWLEEDLQKTDKRGVIFVHHGLAEQKIRENPWFGQDGLIKKIIGVQDDDETRVEGYPEYCLISNREEIRKTISRSEKVVAVFNGHTHSDEKNIHDGVPYFAIQSLVENEENEDIASETRAVVDIDDTRIRVEIRGNYPKEFSHELPEGEIRDLNLRREIKLK